MSTRLNLVGFLVCSLCVAAIADDTPPAEKPAEPAAKPKVAGAVPEKIVVPVQVEARQKQLEARKEATRKLAEAQQSAEQAAKDLAEAEQAAAQATEPEAKQAAAEKVANAREKLDEAKKEAEKRRDELRKAAAANARVMFTARSIGGSTVDVRTNVDRQDPRERFALLAPGGPILVEVAMYLDGKPYRVPREELVDELLKTADTDADGKATWKEALENPLFTLGRIRLTAPAQLEQLTDSFDTNKDALVDRDEVRQFVARYFGGPAFAITNSYNYGGAMRSVVVLNGRTTITSGNAGTADVLKLLDTDEDGALSEKEIAAAGERLKTKDADDNDLVYPAEINGNPAAANNNNIRIVRTFSSARRTQQTAILLGPTADASAVFAQLGQRYKLQDAAIPAAAFASVPKLFEQLDKNSDGRLVQDEVAALDAVKPHVELEIHLGETDGPKGVVVKSLSSELKKSGEAEAELPGIKFDFLASSADPPTANYAQVGDSYLTRYDANKNGYLELNELPNGFASQFEAWDADKDGKVYAKEIVALYERQRAPYNTQVRAATSSDDNSLFRALDQTGDGRLSLREMKTAHVQLAALDKDKSGNIEAVEMPAQMTVAFGRGTTASTMLRTVVGGTVGQANPQAGGDAPEWFTRLDRNGDGDLTLREFLGSKEAFEKIDANGDGFIELKEALAAEKNRAAQAPSEQK